MFRAIIVATAAVSLAAAPQNQKAAAARNVDVYAGVVDSNGKAVTGLGAADFAVKEDGVTREVLKVAPATEPLQVVLVIDDSQAATPAIQFLRDGLNTFVTKLSGHGDIALVTIGERPTSVVEHTTDPEALKKGITRIFARPGSGTYFTEGIEEVTKGLQKRETKRPVIVAVFIEATEFSHPDHTQALKALYASRAQLHVLAVGTPATSTNEEIRNRNRVIDEGTSATGGRRDQLLAAQAIPERLTQVADELLNQYVITYARPESLIPPEKAQISTPRRGLTVHAGTRAAGK